MDFLNVETYKKVLRVSFGTVKVSQNKEIENSSPLLKYCNNYLLGDFFFFYEMKIYNTKNFNMEIVVNIKPITPNTLQHVSSRNLYLRFLKCDEKKVSSNLCYHILSSFFLS